jgi:hypothetical protein
MIAEKAGLRWTDGRQKARIYSIVATYILARTTEIDKTIRTIRRRAVLVKTIRTDNKRQYQEQ